MQHFTTPSCTPAAILLVEDDAPLRQGLTELLSREGYTVMAAACAREAREKLDGSIRLIVLDITLPDGDGVALCRAWRGEGIATPILFLTAKDEEWDVVRGLDAGGNDYVTKPFRMICSAASGRCCARAMPACRTRSAGAASRWTGNTCWCARTESFFP